MWEDSILRKGAKCLKIMARPERFELPTTWFEATYSFAEFSAERCAFLEICFQLEEIGATFVDPVTGIR